MIEKRTREIRRQRLGLGQMCGAVEQRARREPRPLARRAGTRATARVRKRARDARRARAGRRQQRGQQQAFRCRQPRRRLVGQQMRSRVDPFEFAPEAEQIQVGLENFGLRPRRLDGASGARLHELLVPAAAAAASGRSGIDHRRQLHRDGAGAAASRAPVRLSRSAPSAARQSMPSWVQKRWSSPSTTASTSAVETAFERNPLETAHAVIDPRAVDQRAVSIEQICLRRLPARADRRRIRERRRVAATQTRRQRARSRRCRR